jgi:hypothetical protein
MDNKLISIKFCGGCNPKIDRGRIAGTVQEILSIMGHSIAYNRLNVDLVIYISGCTVNCAEQYNRTEVFSIVVAGATIDSMAVEESKLTVEILNRVRDYCAKLEKYIP